MRWQVQPRANKLPACLCFRERSRRERESPEHQRAFSNCTGNVTVQARQPKKTCNASLCTRSKNSHQTSKATENCSFSEPSARVTKAWICESSNRNRNLSIEFVSLKFSFFCPLRTMEISSSLHSQARDRILQTQCRCDT